MTPSIFATQLLAAAAAVIPWIFGGLAAAIVVLVVVLGIRKGLGAMRVVTDDGYRWDQIIHDGGGDRVYSDDNFNGFSQDGF
jgi:hypothetical protein